MNKKEITIRQIKAVELDTFLRDGYLIRDRIQSKEDYYLPHNHDYFEIEIIRYGHCIHGYNNITHDAEAGHAYICTYDDIHSSKFLADTRIFNIRLNESFIDPRLALILLSPSVCRICRFTSEELSYITTLIQILKQEQLTMPDFYDIRAKSLISDIIIMILRKSSGNSVRIPSDNTLKAMSIIIKSFKEPITLAEIADKLELSSDHLGKLLKRNTGLSFNEFLNSLRIRHACNLLINSELSVKEIAFACGYNSVEYFMRCFKKINQKTPIEYKSSQRADKTHKINVLIIGAGYAGSVIADEFSKNSDKYTVIGLIDDDKNKIGRRLSGFTVLGNCEQIPEIVEKHDVQSIALAIPSISPADKSRILSICSETVCDFKILPDVRSLMSGKSGFLKQLTPIKIEDLLGRDEIRFDNREVSQLIAGSVCMVTGGGGSIGSELSRQIARYNPKRLIIVDIYENNAYDIQQELIRKYKNDLDFCIEIASVRDREKLELLFSQYRPDIVFHAAAHKHVPLMETNPEEAVKNNVFGTFNAADLASKYKVKKFVLVSTDKAVNPTNIMGATKRFCEMIVEHFAQKHTHTEYVAVRFGNVLGSNGSVIPLFEKQIASGGPVTVTHPDIVRYFMTIPEAVSLILQAATLARGGEIFVLDMGEPVKILDLAKRMIALYGKRVNSDIDIEFSGLRPGEKLYEELLMNEEGLKKTSNHKIYIGKQMRVNDEKFLSDLSRLHDAAENNDKERVESVLHEAVPTFIRKEQKAIV